jgi:hypothetical protein
MDHHTSPGFSRSRGQPISGYSRSGDRLAHHTSRSSSRHSFQSDSRPTVEYGQAMDRPSQQLIQVDIGGHPPSPTGPKHVSGNFGNLLFLAVFNFRGHFEALNDVFWENGEQHGS